MVVLRMNQHTLPETGKGTRTGTLLQTRHRGCHESHANACLRYGCMDEQ